MCLEEGVIVLHRADAQKNEIVGRAGDEMELEHVRVGANFIGEGLHAGAVLALEADGHPDEQAAPDLGAVDQRHLATDHAIPTQPLQTAKRGGLGLSPTLGKLGRAGRTIALDFAQHAAVERVHSPLRSDGIRQLRAAFARNRRARSNTFRLSQREDSMNGRDGLCGLLLAACAVAPAAAQPTARQRAVAIDRVPVPPVDRFEIEQIGPPLAAPWSLAFLPNGAFLVSEKLGGMRIIAPDGSATPPLDGGPPNVLKKEDSGLLDIALDPDFGTNQTIYVAFAEGTEES